MLQPGNFPKKSAHSHPLNLATLKMLDPQNGPDPIILTLIRELAPNSLVFEYGAGLGRNAIPLAAAGHRVQVQDLRQELLTELKSKITPDLKIETLHAGDAAEHKLRGTYNAFSIIRLLHFLETDDAWKLLERVLMHTESSGLHSLAFFTDESEKPETDLERPFYPSVEEVKNHYEGWQQIGETLITRHEPSETSKGKILIQAQMLFRKPNVSWLMDETLEKLGFLQR